MYHFLRMFLLVACVLTVQTTSQAKIQVVTTFSILGHLVEIVGGEDVDVKTIVGADGDTHVYEPTPDDLKSFVHADLVILNGLNFETWADRLLKAAGYKGPIVIASDGIQPLLRWGAPDPHAWHSVKNIQVYIKNIAAALAEKDPPHAAQYKTRAAAYEAELESLDQEIRTALKGIPENARKIVTAHDAFAYFAAAYGVHFMAPQGVSTQAEPPAKEFTDLVNLLKKDGIKTVFVENIASEKFVKQLMRETGAKMGGTLFSDALSGPKGLAPTYIAMMRHNVRLFGDAMRELI